MLANDAFESFFGIGAQAAVGRRLEEVIGPFFAATYAEYLTTSPTFEAQREGRPIVGRERRTRDGRTFLVDAIRIADRYVLVNFNDISSRKRAETDLQQAWAEVEQAFALTLPNSKVEWKLKSSPEYRDDVDPATGRIRIRRIIPDGTYRHVVNALKVASDLKKVGAMDGLGIDKDRLVQAMIYHDIGKIQPVLQVGDLVDPREVFEPSRIHAARSADFSAGTCVRDEEVLVLIRYHHHSGADLPADFPARRLPMHRLVRLVDGWSAAITGGSHELLARGCDAVGARGQPAAPLRRHAPRRAVRGPARVHAGGRPNGRVKACGVAGR